MSLEEQSEERVIGRCDTRHRLLRHLADWSGALRQRLGVIQKVRQQLLTGHELLDLVLHVRNRLHATRSQ